MTVRLQKNGKMKFEKITPGTLAARFCPPLTLYSWTRSTFAEAMVFGDVYHKLVEGLGQPVQWDEGDNTGLLTADSSGFDYLWWVCHQTNTIYLTTEKQFIYCELVFGNIKFLEVQYGE